MSGLTAGKKRFIKRKLCDENPTVSIGKSGASAELLKRNREATHKEQDGQSQNLEERPL